MLTLLKKFSFGGIEILLVRELKLFYLGNLSVKILSVTNTMKVEMEKDGLYILVMLMRQKFQSNGILGFISLQIR